MWREYRKLWYALLVLVILSPLGTLAQGTAFGEWGREELLERIGQVPTGLDAWADFWRHALLPDYTVPALGEGLMGQVVGYIICAVIGVVVVGAVITWLGRWLTE